MRGVRCSARGRGIGARMRWMWGRLEGMGEEGESLLVCWFVRGEGFLCRSSWSLSSASLPRKAKSIWGSLGEMVRG